MVKRFIVPYLLGQKSMYATMLALYPTDEIENAEVANFPDGANDIPVVDLTVAINPKQSGSGDPSLDNVRPISGWTGANIVVSPTQDALDGTTYAVAFGEAGVVYGGTLDVTIGLVTIDRKMVTLDGNKDWERFDGTNSGGYRISLANAGITDCMVASAAVTAPYVLTNIFPTGNYAWRFGEIGIQNYTIWIGDKDKTIFADLDAFKAALNQTPLQLVYPLAQAITVQLMPTEVETVLGQNYIWCDTGNVSVEYRADVELYIEKKLQPAEASEEVAEEEEEVAEEEEEVEEVAEEEEEVAEEEEVEENEESE